MLKRGILTRNLLIGLVYTFLVLIGLSLHSFWEYPRSYNHVGFNVLIFSKETIELVILVLMFVNVRPRNWPAFFSLEMGED